MKRITVAFLVLMLLATAAPAHADGIIIPRPPPPGIPPFRGFPLTIKYHRVTVTIEDQVATTHVDQVFVNEMETTVEGTYIFPLPEGATISDFAMWVEGERIEGKLLTKEEARAIYESYVRRQQDPALLEYVGRGAFQASIFPIPAGEERRVELTYSEILGRGPRALPLPLGHGAILAPAHWGCVCQRGDQVERGAEGDLLTQPSHRRGPPGRLPRPRRIRGERCPARPRFPALLQRG